MWADDKTRRLHPPAAGPRGVGPPARRRAGLRRRSLRSTPSSRRTACSRSSTSCTAASCRGAPSRRTARPVLVRVTDTGLDGARRRLGRFTGTDPDDGTSYDEEDLSVRLPTRPVPPAGWSAAPRTTSTPGSGTVATTRAAVEGDRAVLGRFLEVLEQPIDCVSSSCRSCRSEPATRLVRRAARLRAARRPARRRRRGRPTSSSVSVRSGARNRRANASDLLALADLVAGVDVEEPHRLQQRRRRPRATSRSASPAVTSSSTTSATSSLATGNEENAGATDRGRRARRSRSRSTSAAAARSGRPNALQTVGCSSPAWPSDVSPTSSSAQRPGCHGARAADRTVDLDAESAGHATDCLDRVAPRGATAGSPPAATRSRSPARTTPEVQRLLGKRLLQVVPLPRRSAVGRRAGSAPATLPPRQGDRRGLEQRDVGLATTDVAGGRLEQARQQRRRHQRLLGAQRVGDPHRGPRGRRPRTAPAASNVAGADEREVDAPRRSRAPASVRPTRRRSRCPVVSPRPAGAVGSTDGTWS